MRARGFLEAAALAAVLCIGGAGIAPAQDAATLADIRRDLGTLSSEIARLRQELSTTGGTGVAVSGDMLDRINTIEAELQRVTARTEELQFRLGRIVEDGTNRLGDLEFRLCEVEPGCDIGSIGRPTPLGGEVAGGDTAAPAPAPQPAAPDTGGTELAVGEEADFRRAQEALASGDFRTAADLFATFRETYPGGPLDAEALMGRARALESAGDTREAARAYLEAYSSHPDSASAPEALMKLGVSLGALGKVAEACVTLSEVGARYPGSELVLEANSAARNLGCS